MAKVGGTLRSGVVSICGVGCVFVYGSRDLQSGYERVQVLVL